METKNIYETLSTIVEAKKVISNEKREFVRYFNDNIKELYLNGYKNNPTNAIPDVKEFLSLETSGITNLTLAVYGIKNNGETFKDKIFYDDLNIDFVFEVYMEKHSK